MTDLQFDQRHLWHPYTRLHSKATLPLVERAEGCTLYTRDHGPLIDAMSSWWSVIHGYNRPELNKAIEDQLGKMAHVMFGGLTHQPAIDLGKKLVDITPPELDAVFFSDSGSVAVEVALKMAVQYWQGREKPHKRQFATLRSGYHGDTFATMSMSDPDDGMHKRFHGLLHEPIFLDAPPLGFEADDHVVADYLRKSKKNLQQNRDKVAALVLEPIMQNAGGMRVYSPEILAGLHDICKELDILLILDEIATGFGRTGRLFAYEWAGICPDILCLGKALTGGYLSLAATIAKSSLAPDIEGPDHAPLMHGPTFMANPLATAAANASIELLLSSNWQQKIKNIARQLREGLSSLFALPQVEAIIVKGAMAAIHLDHPVDAARVQQIGFEHGVWIRPFRNLIYTMPPYSISESELAKVIEVITRSARGMRPAIALRRDNLAIARRDKPST
ncbi:MAG: adenosylmethionine--8-amino-7-oxononanoate transaminase [Bacteroidota bacterium]